MRVSAVRVGLIGAGFAADFHVRSLRQTAGVPHEIVGVAAGRQSSADAFAASHGIPHAYASTAELLASDVDVMSIVVPNALHEDAIVAAAAAGKHIICEKPLTAVAGPPDAAGAGRARREWELARASMDRISAAVERAGVRFMYAENWVYAPAVSKVKSLLDAAGGSILDLRAEQSHSGSHAERTRRRDTAGGGALLTMGAHPISAMLHLKAFESGLPGRRPVRVESVTAEIAALHESAAFAAARGRRYLVEDWDDLETWSNLVIAFSDGSRAVVTATFAMLGGVRNVVEVYTTNGAYRGNITPSDQLLAYTPDAAAFGEEPLHEKLESRTGWMAVAPDEDWVRGYPQQMQDFLECVALGREPQSGLALARDTLDVIHAGYVSAATGERVRLDASSRT